MEANKIKGEAKSIILDNGIELTYCEKGVQNKEVLLCGAFYFHTFMPVVELLAEKYHVYGIVMRLDGKADELNSDNTINWTKQWGKDFYNFVKKLNINKFHYFGKCHGTVPGWYFVKNHPEMLITFSSYFLAPHILEQTANQWFELMQGNNPTEMMKAALRKPEKGIKAKMEEMASLGKIDFGSVENYAGNFSKYLWDSKGDCINTLKTTNVPIEYLFGTEDIFFKDHYDSNMFAIMNTNNAKTVFLGNEKHLMELDCPEKIASEVFYFINEVEKNYN